MPVEVRRFPLRTGGVLVVAKGSILTFEGDAVVKDGEGCHDLGQSLAVLAGPDMQRALDAQPRSRPGEALLTESFRYPNTRFIIHAFGPDFRTVTTPEEARGALATLVDTYRAALARASEAGARTVCLCLLSSTGDPAELGGGLTLTDLARAALTAVRAGAYAKLEEAWIVGHGVHEGDALALACGGVEDAAAEGDGEESQVGMLREGWKFHLTHLKCRFTRPLLL
jgi:O-acetyl-ADP-ribose deacetylase (regulator of RNase III)